MTSPEGGEMLATGLCELHESTFGWDCTVCNRRWPTQPICPRDSGAPQPRGELAQTNATQPVGSPNLSAPDPVRTALARARPYINELAISLPNDPEYKDILILIDAALRAPPQPRGNPLSFVRRDAIAQIIDPSAKFQDIEGVRWSQFEIERRDLAYRKADAIASLPAGALKIDNYNERNGIGAFSIDPPVSRSQLDAQWLKDVAWKEGWQDIKTAPRDRFVLLYCPEDDSRWMAKWQGGEWYGMDCVHGLRRTGQSLNDPDYVTGWFVSHWRDVPTYSHSRPPSGGAA